MLRHTVSQIASDVDRPAVDASLLRRGLAFRVRPEASGTRLDREAASSAVVAALASLLRDGPVRLPTVVTPPKVTREQLAAASRAAATAVSAPVTFSVGPTRFRLPRWRIAELLDLPDGGTTDVGIGGAKARNWLSELERSVRRSPRDATFRVVAGGIEIVPSRPGRALDLDAARSAVERAAFSATNRSATLATHLTEPARTTADAKAMGITGIVGSYTTTYGGTPGRIHNVGLVAELIDGALIAPGSRFSFNQTTGERNAAKGFEEAPVIINGELKTGIGGGVCQVSTTIFNAAFEAGLSIERRTNHALYISHYPVGRDATVNYPDIDLVFSNDTDNWLLIRTFVNAGSLTVNLYGTPQGRRVEAETAPLVVDGKIRIKRIKVKTMLVGKRSIESMGEPPRKTSVRRKVYAPDGKLLYDTTWSSYYTGEPRIVRVGTKPKPKPVEASPDESVTALPPPVRRSSLSPEDVGDEPVGHARRPVGRSVDRRVGRPTRRHALSGALDNVLVTEPRAADLGAAHPDREHVVEGGGAVVLDVDTGRQRLDPPVANRPVATGERRKVGDARLLEPDDERRVVRDPLRVRLGEPDTNVVREAVALHGGTSLRCPAWERRPSSPRLSASAARPSSSPARE